jgi:hypothetical protein
VTRMLLRCKDPQQPQGLWVLSLGDTEGVLTDPQGSIRMRWSPDEPRMIIDLPGSGAGDLGIRDDSGAILWFTPDPEDLHRHWAKAGQPEPEQ